MTLYRIFVTFLGFLFGKSKMKILYPEICYDEMSVSIQKLQEIFSSTLSKMLKTLNAHNFLNIYRNILKLGAQNVRINSRNPTEEEFLQFHLTSSHNYLK